MAAAVRCIIVLLLVAASCKAADAPATGSGPDPVWHLGEPVIDSHVHIYPNMQGLSNALEVFRRTGIGRFVAKSAGVVGTPKYNASLAMQRIVGDRMRLFANLDWEDVDGPGWTERQLASLEQMKKDGIIGIKVFKNVGLSTRLRDGTLLKVDDPRLAPVFDACARLGLIFAWHVADPVAFFKAPTPDNERYDELKIAKSWSFYGQDFPSFQSLMDAMVRVIDRHPKTTFLLIHLGCNAEDLDFVDRLLEGHPNVHTDVSARVPEFGRHPADKVKAFFVKHQDRILFGSDFISDGDGSMQLGSVWHVPDVEPGMEDAVEFFTRHWRYFETDAKQIEHPTPIQGRWKVDAIGLPRDVLKKFYVTNAEKLLFGQRPAR